MATTNTARRTTAPRTHEGGAAKRIDAEAQLRRTLMACMLWEDTFYEDGQSVAERIRSGVAALPLEVSAALAVEAREVMHIRHAPLLVAREMARQGGAVAGDTIARVIQRPDELTEFLSLYWQDGKQPLSAQVKRGLALAFTKFDAYGLAKYDQKDKAVRLRDVLFMTHPKPKDGEQADVWRKLVDGTLESPDTWEVALSSGGDKLEHWTRLLVERKLGGLALLRNLRNMTQAGVQEWLIREAIADNQFRRVLPFRFVAAARYAPGLEDALEAAMFRSLADAPRLPGRTALLLDNSGSMWSPLSERSDMGRTDAAAGLGMLLREVCEDVVVIGFGTQALRLPPRRGFALRDAYISGPGGGTNTETAKQLAEREGYDRIIILTDEQSHQRLSDPTGCATGYVVNIATNTNGIGYGRWTHIDGWSEGVVRYIMAAEGIGG